uniref:Bromo domain-containing protein n=2 Tax=Chrysotila carterae TaxID=13221 RepID=A0A6S9US33_CHRCT|mmetsp:Transcript_2173/g.4533  ORF Transcript_2173/g.4533 Transcript_2173/m.4533 type:complete len:296 (+) Transcript_2173:356-1243(+)
MGGAHKINDLLGPPSMSMQPSKQPKTKALLKQRLLQQRARRSSRTSISAADKQTVKAEAAERKQCLPLVKALLRSSLAWPFAKPVDPVAYPDYYTVVRDPIDLGTIQERLISGKCKGWGEFVADVQRVWSNCFLYHAQGTDEHRMATQLLDIFAQKCHEAKMKQMEKQMKEPKKPIRMMQEILAESKMAHRTSEPQTLQMTATDSDQFDVDFDVQYNKTLWRLEQVKRFVDSCTASKTAEEGAGGDSVEAAAGHPVGGGGGGGGVGAGIALAPMYVDGDLLSDSLSDSDSDGADF